MRRSPEVSLGDMRDFMRDAINICKGKSFENLQNDRVFFLASVKSIELSPRLQRVSERNITNSIQRFRGKRSLACGIASYTNTIESKFKLYGKR